jgi:hypothetical protein
MRPNLYNARQTVAELRAALLSPSPEGLETFVPALEAAVRDLETLQAAPGLPPRGELESFSKELLGVARLVEHAITFNQGWARVLAAATSNYQPTGQPATAALAGSVFIKG